MKQYRGRGQRKVFYTSGIVAPTIFFGEKSPRENFRKTSGGGSRESAEVAGCTTGGKISGKGNRTLTSRCQNMIQ